MSDTSCDTTPGRPVRLVPTAPGFWMLTLGVCIAALSPLFGFLVGVMSQRPDGDVALDPLYFGLLIGVVVGGIGVLLAVLGGVRLWKHYKGPRMSTTQDGEAP